MAIEQLLQVMSRLRDPQGGCAWDLEQSFASIAPYTIEEAYEVADAIERHNLEDLKEELGDLLLQVVFHSQMAAEQHAFSFNDVVQVIVDKLIRRHPHVFSDSHGGSAAEVTKIWEAEKARERANKVTEADEASALDGIAVTLPALNRADKLQRRASMVGFDWPDQAPVWDKIREEMSEVKVAVQAEDSDAIEDELGDLLFAVVNLVRHLGLNPETALRRANNKFECRFRCVEKLAMVSQQSLAELGTDALDVLWGQAKQLEKGG